MPMTDKALRGDTPTRRDLAPARGIARGVVLGLLAWLVLLLLWFI
jgi:hypothetical protein